MYTVEMINEDFVGDPGFYKPYTKTNITNMITDMNKYIKDLNDNFLTDEILKEQRQLWLPEDL